MTAAQSRVQAGVPTGGQFSATTLAESELTLDGPDTDLFGAPAAAPDVRREARGEDVSGLDLSYGQLRDARLDDADATGTRFYAADLRGAHMAGIHADRADFTKADLSGADIHGGSFVEAQFRDATISGFEGSDFSLANLEDAEISHATGANFSHACLAGATLTGHFENCDFRGADLRGAHMSHVHNGISGRTPVSFKDCLFDDDPWDGGAEWPSEFDPRENAEFRRHSFTADEQAHWQEVGITDPVKAARFRDHGFTCDEAADWHTQGITDARTAKDFRDAGFEPGPEAEAYAIAGVDARTAKSWDDHDFRAASYGGTLGHHEDAVAWSRQGIDPLGAQKWSLAGYTAPEAAALIDTGINWPHETTVAPARKTAIDAARADITAKRIPAAALRRERDRLQATGDLSLGSADEVRLRAIEAIEASRRRNRI